VITNPSYTTQLALLVLSLTAASVHTAIQYIKRRIGFSSENSIEKAHLKKSNPSISFMAKEIKIVNFTL